MKNKNVYITPSSQRFKDSIFKRWGKGGGAYIIGGNTSLAPLIVFLCSANVVYRLANVLLVSFERFAFFCVLMFFICPVNVFLLSLLCFSYE